MLHSTVTNCFPDQYTCMPLLCSSTPNHFPLLTLPPSLFPSSTQTNTLSPHSRTSVKLGFLPKAASKGVLPSTALVEVLFINHTTWRTASPHKYLGKPLACSRARMCSSMVQFRLSATPFWAGES